MAQNLAANYPAHLQSIRSRHDDALAETGFDHVVIFSGSERVIFLDDSAYPFKVNAHFKSWVPIVDNPDSFVVYTPGKKPVLLYYQPLDYWYEPAADPAGFWVDQFDVVMIRELADAKAHMPKGRVAFIGEGESSFDGWGFAATNPENLVNRLHWERSWKTDYELDCIREAARIGVDGHRAALRAFGSGASEFDIHVEYMRATRHTEAELPYGNIVALNEGGSVLHYMHLRKKAPAERHSFLIDAGAQFNGYACDITRTYSANGSEFGELVAAVDRFQQDLCEMIQPGVDYKDVHMRAHLEVGKVLHEMGFVDMTPEAMVERRVTGAFFPHGVGHFLGLQVHDVAGFMANREGETIPRPEGHPFLRLTRVVEPRMVFTIEPGIYFIDLLLTELRKSEDSKHVDWAKVDSFRKFGGVRIEDDIAVTESGRENLTRDAFAAASTS